MTLSAIICLALDGVRFAEMAKRRGHIEIVRFFAMASFCQIHPIRLRSASFARRHVLRAWIGEPVHC